MKLSEKEFINEKFLNQQNQFREIFQHDFLNYLNGVIGFSELSISDLNLMKMENLTIYLDIIIEQAENAKVLVSTFNSLSSSSCINEFSKVSLLSCFDKLLSSHQEFAKRKGIELSHYLDEEIFIDTANEISLCFILNNFLTNSLKFTGQGGRVVLRSKRLSDGSVEIHVEDNGIGISPDRLSELFSDVVPISGTDSEKGFGIGLKLCKKIAERSGIKLTIESEENVGTVAKILLK